MQGKLRLHEDIAGGTDTRLDRSEEATVLPVEVQPWIAETAVAVMGERGGGTR